MFCNQLADLFDQLITTDKRFIICGDFNCPGVDDNLIDDNLDDVLQRYDLVQHVRSPTHVDGNTLDLILTSSSEVSLLSDISVCSTCFSDHHAVACRLHITSNHPSIMRYQFRDTRRVDIAAFHCDVEHSSLYDFTRDRSADE